MAHDLVDAVGDTTSTTGTADFVIDGVALTGCVSFASALTNGLTYGYRCETSDKTSCEVGSGTWTSATSTLSRTSVSRSSNGGAKVSFASGAKSIGIVIQAQDFASAATDANISMSDITTNNVSTTKHGFAPKAPNDATKFLDGTGAYSTPAGGAPGGSGTEIQYRNAGAFAAMSGSAWDDTNRALTMTGATVTTSNPVQSFTQTWNAGGVTFTGWKLNVTNTASAAGSMLTDFQVGSSSKAAIMATGALRIGSTYLSPTGSDFRAGTTDGGVDGAFRASRYRDDTNQVTVGTINSVSGLLLGKNNAQGVFWSTTGNWFDTFGTGLSYVAGGVVGVGTGASGSFAGDIKLRGVICGTALTVATLPTASTVDGGVFYVSDLTSLTNGSTPTGSGSSKGLVKSNGTAYIVLG